MDGYGGVLGWVGLWGRGWEGEGGKGGGLRARTEGLEGGVRMTLRLGVGVRSGDGDAAEGVMVGWEEWRSRFGRGGCLGR